MMDQHFQEHLCELEVCNEELVLQPGSGIPQGSSSAPNAFNRVSSKSLRSVDTYLKSANDVLVSVSPITGNSINTALTNFVDDVASILEHFGIQRSQNSIANDEDF